MPVPAWVPIRDELRDDEPYGAPQLDVPVRLKASKGPGITAVAVHTTHGDITISRPTGGVAHLSRPGFPAREAALARRTTEGLIAEELRRLDPDEVYGETLAAVPALVAQPPLPVAAATMTRPSDSGAATPRATRASRASRCQPQASSRCCHTCGWSFCEVCAARTPKT